MGKLARKINKAVKIIKNEGLLEFTLELGKRVVYGMVHIMKSWSVLSEYFFPEKARKKILFTEKKIMPGLYVRDDSKELQRLFANIKAEILSLIK